MVFFIIIYDYIILKIDYIFYIKYKNHILNCDGNIAVLTRKIKFYISIRNIIKKCRFNYWRLGVENNRANEVLYKKLTENNLLKNIYKVVYFFFGPLKKNLLTLLITLYFYSDLIMYIKTSLMRMDTGSIQFEKDYLVMLPSTIIALVIISSLYFLSSKGKVTRSVYIINQEKLATKIKFHLKNKKLISEIIYSSSKNINTVFLQKNIIIKNILKESFPNITYVNSTEVKFGFERGEINGVQLKIIEEIEEIKLLYNEYSSEVDDNLFYLSDFVKKNCWLSVMSICHKLDLDKICFTETFINEFSDMWKDSIKRKNEITKLDYKEKEIIHLYNEINEALTHLIVDNIENLINMTDYCRYVEKRFGNTPLLFNFFGFIANKEK